MSPLSRLDNHLGEKFKRSGKQALFNSNAFFSDFQRMDLGDCAKLHNLALKADYEIASQNKDYFYDLDVSPFTIAYLYAKYVSDTYN